MGIFIIILILQIQKRVSGMISVLYQSLSDSKAATGYIMSLKQLLL